MIAGVILDRDGVINEIVYNPRDNAMDSPTLPGQIRLVNGVAELIRHLNEWEIPVAVASNQPGVAKAKLSSGQLDAITARILELLESEGAAINRIFYCLHHPDAVVPALRYSCPCRKPRPGLLLEAAEELDLDLARSVFIGDRTVDMIAGAAAGTRNVFLGEVNPLIATEFRRHDIWPDRVVTYLPQLGRWPFQLMNPKQEQADD
jgi:D-glycero-D-manno-heptose 1,7-bisphosphate phosphatase